MSTEIVAVRNDISGVSYETTEDVALETIANPVWGGHLSIVRTSKPEVLKHPKPDEKAEEKKDK